MKKIIALTLALMMVFALATTANAAEETGSITINGVNANAVYAAYKLLDLESYNTTSGAYSYTVNEAWTGFFNTTEAQTYVTIDTAGGGYVSWIAGEDDSTVAAFAKLALAYAKSNGIAPVKSSSTTGDMTITGTNGKFENLSLGWYLVDTSMGALCGLTTTNPNASINAKNGIPTIDKQVVEDSTNQTVKTNTADIGQIMDFQITISVHPGAENYTLHDKMDPGIKFISLTRIDRVVPGDSTKTVDPENYVLTTTAESEAENADIHEFEIAFEQAFCDQLSANNKIIVYYKAMLTRDAVIAGVGNDNTTWLTFGDTASDHKSNESSTTTYTYGIDIVKTDSQNTLIDGAVFKIYDAATGGNEVPVVLMDDNVTYRRARAGEGSDTIKVEGGKVRVIGFDNGTYYLEETEAPDGYNKLTARQQFIISDGNLDAIFNDDVFSSGSGVHVVNKTGSMLPETGSIGTTLFITFGTMVVMATGVLLVTKKRMSMIEE